MQSGPLATQSDYGILYPREEISWTEYWYPIHGFENEFEYANKDIAIETIYYNDKVQFGLLSTAEFTNVTFTVSSGEEIILEELVNLSPKNILKLEVPREKDSIFTIKIWHNKENIASFVSPLQIPKVVPPKVSIPMEKAGTKSSVEENFLIGQKFDLEINRKKASNFYKSALRKDSLHSKSLRALAIFDIKSGLYDKARLKLEKALVRNQMDGLTWYFLGITYLKQDNFIEALNCASKVVHCPGTPSLGYSLSGRSYMKLRKYKKSIDAFKKSIELNPLDQLTQNHLMLSLYALGEKDAAIKKAEELIKKYPLDLTPRSLVALQEEATINQFVINTFNNTGDVFYELSNTASIFKDVGLFKEASTLLSNFATEAQITKKQNPLILYFLAYLYELQNKESQSDLYLDKASKIYGDYVFASQPHELEILEHAIEKKPFDSYAHLHLGNLYAHLGRVEESVTMWNRTISLNSELSMPYRNLGLYEWKIKNNLERAEYLYKRAIAIRSDDQTLYRDLAQILLAGRKTKETIKILESIPRSNTKRSDVLILQIDAYIQSHMYTRAIDLINETQFIPWEGQAEPWILFNRAYTLRGIEYFEKRDYKRALNDFKKSITFPDNLRIGRFEGVEDAHSLYWIGRTYKKMGQNNEAVRAWKEGASRNKGSMEQNKYLSLCKELSGFGG